MTTKLNRRERRAAALLAHYGRCEALARHLGVKEPDGKRISVALLKIEAEAHRAMEHACSSPESFVSRGGVTFEFSRDEDALAQFCGSITAQVLDVFRIPNGQTIPGFLVNRDPRGYALKIIEQETQRLADAGIVLEKDWGGYGLLSPEITG